MGAFRETVREVSLEAAGGADTLRVWDNPEGEPFQDLAITLTSRGTILPANDLDWTVYRGGTWSVGAPFASGSTLSNGTNEASGTIAGGTAFETVIYTNAGPFPANRRVQVPSGSGYIYKGLSGHAWSVELVNKKASAITVYVVFNSNVVSTPL